MKQKRPYRLAAIFLLIAALAGLSELSSIANDPAYADNKTALLLMGCAITIIFAGLSYFFWKKK